MSCRRIVSVVLVAVLWSGVSVMPAAAHDKSDVGAFTGTINVGKSGTCLKNGVGTVSGEGLGLPFFSQAKKGWWNMNVGLVTEQHPTGLMLVACGRLAPVNGTQKDGIPPGSKQMVGAACGASHGHDGFGEVLLSGVPHYRLKNVRWPAAVGTTLPIIADWWRNTPNQGYKKDVKTVGTVVAKTQATGGAACLTKGGTPGRGGLKGPADPGATSLAVAGTFVAVKEKGTPGGGPKKGN